MSPNSSQRPVLPSLDSMYRTSENSTPVTSSPLSSSLPARRLSMTEFGMRPSLSSSIPSPVVTSASVTADVLPFQRLKFVQNDGQPHAKRRRISAACKTCRKRKTRCSGEKPVCETCKQNGQECLGYAEPTPKGGPRHARRDSKNISNEQSLQATDGVNFFSAGSFRPHQRHASQPALSTHSSTAGDYSQPPSSPSPLGIEMDVSMVKLEDEIFDQEMTEDADSPDITYEQPVLTTRGNRLPYFRYFGPTAIAPGYKQMVVEVKGPRSNSSQSNTSGSTVTSPVSPHDSVTPTIGSQTAGLDEGLPLYDPQDAGPVHPLILHLVVTFFAHLGSNFPFIRKEAFMRAVEEGQANTLLVDAVCSVSARFSTDPLLQNLAPSSRGIHFANRAKANIVDTFACPNLKAVQACLLLAYSEFGSNRDSGLWMFVGCAIRMAQDLGLHKLAGMRGQQRDNIEISSRRLSPDDLQHDDPNRDEGEYGGLEGREADERERTDTFWALYFLDRVISSGTGRPVTLKDSEIELYMPPMEISDGQYPLPFPALLRVIRFYGKATDILNKKVNDSKDSRGSASNCTLKALARISEELHIFCENLSPKLGFNVPNFNYYVTVQQSSVFLLLHFWLHALIVLLHQPTVLIEGQTSQLSPESHKLSMSSAKTIADIFHFLEENGLDIKPARNPFTSQPIYIAACAFLQESASRRDPGLQHQNQRYARVQSIPMPAVSALSLGSPSASLSSSDDNCDDHRNDPASGTTNRRSTNSLLDFSPQQHYQQCYKALKDIEICWGGVKYILTVMDQKAKGITDPILYTDEELETPECHYWNPKIFDLIKKGRDSSVEPLGQSHQSGSTHSSEQESQHGFSSEDKSTGATKAIGVSLTGLTDSSTSVLNFVYQPPQSTPSYPTNALMQLQQQQQQQQNLMPSRSYPDDNVLLGLTTGPHLTSTAPPGFHPADGHMFGSGYHDYSGEVDVGHSNGVDVGQLLNVWQYPNMLYSPVDHETGYYGSDERKG